jgi:hypothetical protein
MRFCGGFVCGKQLSCPKKGHETGSAARESVHSSFLPIDDTDHDSALETGLAKNLECLDGSTAGGDDVLDEADPIAGFPGSFEPVRGSVLLRRLAHDEERELRREGSSRRERDGTELRAGEPYGVRLVLADCDRDVLAERGEQVWPGLEAVLVEVVARPAPGAKDEITLEVGVLAQRRGEVVPLHDRAARTASRANGSSRAAWGESPVTETMEPSAK